MMTSDLKVAWRSLRKGGAYSAINLFGLAFGLACCLLLVLWIRDELSFDRHNANAGRIFRVESADLNGAGSARVALTSAALAPALLAEFPEIEKAVRFANNEFQVTYQGRRFVEKVFFGDPEVFGVFDIPLARGDVRTCLSGPSNILLSQTAARKVFGADDPLGKTLAVRGLGDMTVTGLFRDIPANSHMHFDFLGQFSAYAGRTLTQWGISNYYTYILGRPGFRPQAFEAKFPAFIRKYQTNVPAGSTFGYALQPLTRIHLYGHARGEIEANGRAATIAIFSIVILFVLLVACFNYINFATAKVTSRMREVGVRKAVGAGRREVAAQFLTESLLMSAIALAAAVLTAEILLPVFSALTGKTFSADFLRYPDLLAAGLALGLLAGFLAGSYPAFVLSAAPPAQVLKGGAQGRFKGSAVRSGLVVVQFAVSIAFLIGSIVIARQMHFVRTMDLGLDKDHIVAIPVRDESALARLSSLEQEAARLPGIVSVTAASFKPGPGVYHQNYWREGMSENEYPMIAWMAVDFDFVRTLGMHLVAGRDFDRNHPSDAGEAYLINEAAGRELGWSTPAQALGRAFKIVGKGTIIGVVKNFNFDSLRSAVEPLALNIYKPGFENLYARVRPDRTPETLAGLKRIMRDIAPSQPFDYAFLDQEFDDLYRGEQRLGRVFAAVTAASIIIAGLGLLGLAALAARCRTREIGIRKVLGASTAGVVALLARDFSRWVLAANVIAWPVAYYAMSRWLRDFAYRTPISFWMFLAACAATFGAAMLAVSWQSFKAARANPADSLHYE